MKKHILIIDDEPAIRDILKLSFEKADYRATAVSNKHDALKVARTDAPDLIVSDLQLAEEDGLIVLQELKAVLPLAPSLLLSGVIFSPAVSLMLEKTVSAYLPKTTRFPRILQTVRELLGDRDPSKPEDRPLANHA